jgi:hypothetical protein
MDKRRSARGFLIMFPQTTVIPRPAATPHFSRWIMLCCLGLWWATYLPARAQEPPRPDTTPSERRERSDQNKNEGRPLGPRRPPTEGDRQKQNHQTWEAASDEERQAYRERARALREQSAQHVREILLENGLTLDETQRREFFHAYMKGRRQIERALREQMQQERERQEKALIQELLKTFSKPE